jgi:hypothetical protein
VYRLGENDCALIPGRRCGAQHRFPDDRNRRHRRWSHHVPSSGQRIELDARDAGDAAAHVVARWLPDEDCGRKRGTARLELFEWGARVQTSGLFGWLGLRWEVRYSELVQARPITYPIANRGVLLRTDGSAVSLAFTTFRGPEILDQLAARGVPVDRSVTPLRRTDLDTSALGFN